MIYNDHIKTINNKGRIKMKNLKIDNLVNKTILNMAAKRGLTIDEDEKTLMIFADLREGYGDDYCDSPYVTFMRNQETGELFFGAFGDGFEGKKVEDICHWLSTPAMLKTLIVEIDKVL